MILKLIRTKIKWKLKLDENESENKYEYGNYNEDKYLTKEYGASMALIGCTRCTKLERTEHDIEVNQNKN